MILVPAPHKGMSVPEKSDPASHGDADDIFRRISESCGKMRGSLSALQRVLPGHFASAIVFHGQAKFG